MSHKLLLLTRENDKYLPLLQQYDLPSLSVVDDQPEHINHADIWLAEPGLAAPLVSVAPQLQWIQSTFAGVDKLMQLRRPLTCQLTNIKQVFGPLMSEYVFGYLLSIYRQQQLYHQQQAAKVWQEGRYTTLQGKSLLVLGTGSIGTHLASTARHFGMRAIGINRRGGANAAFEHVADISQLSAQLQHADVIVNALPHTPQTTRLFDSNMLALLKQNAIFINVGRGSIVDINLLTQFLQQRNDVTAILDVFEQEPLNSEHLLWQLPNAIITPHIAAPSFPEQVVAIFAENYQRFIQGDALLNRVDMEAGY
ncbi:dihydrofolate reductase [Shewanella mangrovi]|uniref:Dihydrofolate reductase n=1 Tax=Shewanella mangrovi TaxID=1515746 RepID=A0A094LLK1_9GAMM|nr:D-2-hydroxyacid dehydrogenase [Shewanella mangrovi]KFZ36018.1 dihydrofolate reductase [Shewanella mangrovi]